MERRIVCAAIRNSKGIILVGVRHYDTFMRQQIRNFKTNFYNCEDHSSIEQGFLDNRFQFLTRKEAWEVAKNAGQIIRDCSEEGTLYSENLY